MEIEKINRRINREFSQKTLDRLSDETLNKKYLKTKSVANKIDEITKIMEEVGISEKHIKQVIKKYNEKLIPPGTKGSLRGNEFNNLIKREIISMKLDDTKFEVKFEKKNLKLETHEIPDWYIECKSSGKILIGMNQLDFWGGGQQINRGYKYLFDDKINSNKSKLLCVICNYKQITRKNTNTYKLFNRGFQNNTLCYIKNLKNIIKQYFDIID